MRWLIRGGRVVDPVSGLDQVMDILIEDGRIARLGSGLEEAVDSVLEARGLLVVPGLVDGRCRVGVPQREDREDFVSVSRAALAGGYASLVVQTDPPAADPQELAGLAARAQREASCRVHLVASLARDRGAGSDGTPEGVSEVYALKEAGAVALVENGLTRRPDRFRRALQYARDAGLVVMVACGNPYLDGSGSMHEGTVSSRLGLAGIPRSSELLAVFQALTLAEETGCPVHVGPITTQEAVEMIARAKERGVPVTADTTVLHTILTHEALADFEPHLKVYPPLREARDRQALREGLADGIIDCLVSGHVPLRLEEAVMEFDRRPFGVSGLETAVALALTHLVQPGHLTLAQWVSRTTWGPARTFGLPGGRIEEGAPADLTLIDPEASWQIDVQQFRSRGRNSPFHGQVVQGRVVRTLLGGPVGAEV